MGREYRVKAPKSTAVVGLVSSVLMLLGGTVVFPAIIKLALGDLNDIPEVSTEPTVTGSIYPTVVWGSLVIGLMGIVVNSWFLYTGKMPRSTIVLEDDVVLEPASDAGRDTATFLQELDELKRKNLVTDLEYRTRREKILSRFT